VFVTNNQQQKVAVGPFQQPINNRIKHDTYVIKEKGHCQNPDGSITAGINQYTTLNLHLQQWAR
jgi:restriction endonuclease Mrr